MPKTYIDSSNGIQDHSIPLIKLAGSVPVDSSLVHIAGTETITGNKTFSGALKAVTKTSGTNTTDVATTAFVQSAISSKANDASVVHVSGTENIGGSKTFTSTVKAAGVTVGGSTIGTNTITTSYFVSNDTDFSSFKAVSGSTEKNLQDALDAKANDASAVHKSGDTMTGTLVVDDDFGTVTISEGCVFAGNNIQAEVEVSGSAGSFTTASIGTAEIDTIAVPAWGSVNSTGASQTLQQALNAKANLASPTFTGSPKAPTAASGTSTTQIATTAFVQNAVSGISAGPWKDGGGDGAAILCANSDSSTAALGIASFAAGVAACTSATGIAATATGISVSATGMAAHAEGNGTMAEAMGSHAEGNGTHIFQAASYAHAEGQLGRARGESSHVEGESTESLGKGSHAEGGATKAGGDYSHAEGNSTTTNNMYEHAEGHFNYSHTDASTVYPRSGNTIHSVGIGSNLNNRKNAFEIMQDGSVYIYGLGGYNGTNPSQSTSLQNCFGVATNAEIDALFQPVLTWFCIEDDEWFDIIKQFNVEDEMTWEEWLDSTLGDRSSVAVKNGEVGTLSDDGVTFSGYLTMEEDHVLPSDAIVHEYTYGVDH